jgi:hypothetical protein
VVVVVVVAAAAVVVLVVVVVVVVVNTGFRYYLTSHLSHSYISDTSQELSLVCIPFDSYIKISSDLCWVDRAS